MLFAILFSLSSYAQVHVEVRPTFPAKCEKRDYAHISFVSQPQIVHENESELTLTFYFRHAECETNTIMYRQIEQQLFTAGIFTSACRIGWEFASASEVQMSALCNKTKLFGLNKSKPKTEKKSDMIFLPYGNRYYQLHSPHFSASPTPWQHPLAGLNFPWKIRFLRLSPVETQVEIL